MKKLLSLRSDARGNVLIMTAFGILLLTAVAGAATDIGRWALVELQVQQAVDAAALAAAALPDKKSDGTAVTDADRDAAVTRYFAMNYPANFMGVAIPPSAARPTYGASEITITVDNVTMPTLFMRFVGLTTLPVHASNGLKITSNTNSTNYDIMLVLDNSGSMALADVGSVNSREVPAAQVDTINQQGAAHCSNYYHHLSGLAILYPSPSAFDAAVATWCTLASGSSGFGLTEHTRINALRYAANIFATNLLTKNSHSLVGAVTWSDGVIPPGLPPTSDLPTITNYLDGMFAWGGTNSYEGFRKAQELAAHFDPSHVHVVIYITDGINTIADSASEHYVPPPSSAPPGTPGTITDSHGCNGHDLCIPTNDLTKPICKNFKDSGTQIYTIAFGTEISDPTAQAFMQSCASTNASGNPNFYIAPDAQSLSSAFDGILTSIRKIKIVR